MLPFFVPLFLLEFTTSIQHYATNGGNGPIIFQNNNVHLPVIGTPDARSENTSAFNFSVSNQENSQIEFHPQDAKDLQDVNQINQVLESGRILSSVELFQDVIPLNRSKPLPFSELEQKKGPLLVEPSTHESDKQITKQAKHSSNEK